jgi:membrane-associated protein
VVTPFLPGDSLLFVAGAVAAGGALDPHALAILLAIAAILGNSLNYAIGRWLGSRFFRNEGARWLNPRHLRSAREFYELHGGKAVVISRFLPIVRTYIPFVAGMAKMPAPRFEAFNAVGAAAWVGLLTYAGYFFGNIPWIRGNLTALILAIIVLSLAPLAAAFVRSRLAARRA